MKKLTKAKSRFNPERSRTGSNSSTRRTQSRIRVRTRCFFDEKGTSPDYRDEAVLIKFLTKRGKIRPRTRSGLCSKHQRMIAREIKRARNLGLLPYRIIG